jgi:hypothetical protein
MTKHFRATTYQTTYQTRHRAALTTQALRAGVTPPWSGTSYHPDDDAVCANTPARAAKVVHGMAMRASCRPGRFLA